MAKNESLVDLYLILLQKKFDSRWDNLLAMGGVNYQKEMDKILGLLANTESPNQLNKLQTAIVGLQEELSRKDSEIVNLKTEIEELEQKKPKKRKPSRVRYADERKLQAIQAWEALDKTKRPVTVEEFLLEEFGETAGTLNVAKSTFYGWKKPLEEKGLYKESE